MKNFKNIFKINIRLQRRIFYLWIGLFFIQNLSSQKYFFDKYGVEEGLAQSTVFSIIQTHNDYIWMGTEAGVSRFDGFEFQNFSEENGLISGSTRVLFEDSYNNIWMGHWSGDVTRYKNGKFEKISVLDTLIEEAISSFVEDTLNRLWITTLKNGVFLIENPNSSIKSLKYKHFIGKELGDIIFSASILSDGSLYFMTSAGIKKLNYSDLSFYNYVPGNISFYFPKIVMIEDSKKNQWFGTYNGGLDCYIPAKDTLLNYDIKDGLATNYVNYIIEDRYGNIWTSHWDDRGEKGGVTRISPQGEFSVFNSLNGLHGNKVFCLIEDKEGNILIGTKDHGFDIFKGEQFISYSTDNGLINNQVNAILQDNAGQYWFGTNGGITIYNPVSQTFTNYDQNKNYASNFINFLKVDKNNNIWIGTDDQGVIFYNTRSKRFILQSMLYSKFPFESKSVTAMEIDHKNNLWIGTNEGLLYYDINSGEFIKTYTQGDGLLSNKISSLFNDSKGNLWIGSKDNGFNVMDEKRQNILKFKFSFSPTCMTEDLNKNIWMGTLTDGVIVFKDKIVHRYTTKDGLLANLVSLINVDNNNIIYIGTYKGLNTIDQNNSTIFTYTKKSGLIGTEIRNNATFKDDSGNLWFGTIDGVTCYRPDKRKKEDLEPLTHILAMTVNGKNQNMTDNLKLPYNQRRISFTYTSICLSDPEAVRYKIILDGYNKEWESMGNISAKEYGSLDPGKYKFKVIASNNKGKWNTSPVQYNFQILAPLYQRGWFIFLIVFIVFSAIYSFIKMREKNLITEKRILEERVKERTVELSNANDELEKKNKDITDSIRYAKRIQFSILPDLIFEDTFILFKPRDIVSGDFYWLVKHNGLEFIAAVDCTGHGVPGAFMSFIGYTSLNKIVKEYEITNPAEVLTKLDEEVTNALHQKGDDGVRDGMDITFTCFNPKTMELQFAGAYNPLWHIHNNQLEEYKADRIAIGRVQNLDEKFTNYKIKVSKGDCIYLFTDGYVDQFGGEEYKKFKIKNFRELIQNIHPKNMDEQKIILDETIENWKGDDMQIDDILVIGRRF